MVLRNWRPITRPTRWAPGLEVSFANWDKPATWKLFPGPASDGEHITLSVYNAGTVHPNFVGIYASLAIDSWTMTSSRPGQLWIPDADELPALDAPDWSCIIHMPATGRDEPTIYTVLLRALHA